MRLVTLRHRQNVQRDCFAMEIAAVVPEVECLASQALPFISIA
jgi:hypothetical protein